MTQPTWMQCISTRRKTRPQRPSEIKPGSSRHHAPFSRASQFKLVDQFTRGFEHCLETITHNHWRTRFGGGKAVFGSHDHIRLLGVFIVLFGCLTLAVTLKILIVLFVARIIPHFFVRLVFRLIRLFVVWTLRTIRLERRQIILRYAQRFREEKILERPIKHSHILELGAQHQPQGIPRTAQTRDSHKFKRPNCIPNLGRT